MERPQSERESMGRAHNRLFGKDWSVSDPTSEALSDAMHAMRYTPTQVTDSQRWLVLSAAEAWVHFGAYGTGPYHRATESVVRQLRQVRRAVETP